MGAIVFGEGPLVEKLQAHLGSTSIGLRPVAVASASEFTAQSTPDVVGFVTEAALAQLAGTNPTGPVVVLVESQLADAVGHLGTYPWLNHSISGSLLVHPLAASHILHVLRTCLSRKKPRLLEWVGEDIGGRRIRLVNAGRRFERIERMTEYFEKSGVGERTTEHLRDVAEELLTNAFYDAPAAAGVFSRPVSREVDLVLPDDCACDLAYGAKQDFAFVRVKDVFGSLSRRRIVEVLGRCARTDMQVQVDESMGGAGLGMWRIFSVATFVGISVVKDSHTEIVVGIAKKQAGSSRPFAFHLFFRDGAKRRSWLFDKDTSQVTVNRSVIIDTNSK